jgi:hypothetical protein
VGGAPEAFAPLGGCAATSAARIAAGDDNPLMDVLREELRGADSPID